MAATRARIFVSCGQRPHERTAASRIRDLLTRLGFDAYLAVEHHSPKSLKENIFSRLRGCEYYLMVDFPRENLGRSQSKRGSLFVHQELALASMLDVDCLFFQDPLIKREGILDAIQGNAIPFSDIDDLMSKVENEVSRRWNPHWMRALSVDRDDQESDHIDFPVRSRWYHLRITNRSIYLPAHNCTAYVDSIMSNETHGEAEGLRRGELKWAGITQTSVRIGPGQSRDLDAGFIAYEHPSQFNFAVIGDSSYYTYPSLVGPSQFSVTYAIESDNFPLAKAKIGIRLGAVIDDASVTALSVI